MGQSEAEEKLLHEGWTIQRTKLTESFNMDKLRAQRDPASRILFAVSSKGAFISPALASQFKPGSGSTIFLFGPQPTASPIPPAQAVSENADR